MRSSAIAGKPGRYMSIDKELVALRRPRVKITLVEFFLYIDNEDVEKAFTMFILSFRS